MVNNGGEHGRHFDHPGDGTPEITEKLEDGAGFLFDDFVIAELLQPFGGLGGGKALRGGGQFLHEFRYRQLFHFLDVDSALQHASSFRGRAH
jgi:hypothetical protein